LRAHCSRRRVGVFEAARESLFGDVYAERTKIPIKDVLLKLLKTLA
jgi:hypothetical protein